LIEKKFDKYKSKDLIFSGNLYLLKRFCQSHCLHEHSWFCCVSSCSIWNCYQSDNTVIQWM